MKKAFKWLEANFEPTLMVTLFVLMILLVTVQVILRIFGMGFNWGEEMARLLFVWMSYISFGYLTRNNRHVRMAFARDFLPDKIRRAVMILCDILFLVFLVFGFAAAIKICQQTAKFGDMLVTIRISANIIYSAGVVGFLLMVIRRIQTIVWKIKYFNDDFDRFENAEGKYYTNVPVLLTTIGEPDVENHNNLNEGG